jgi:hypothetical protein
MNLEPDLSNLRIRIREKLKFEPKHFMSGSSAKQMIAKRSLKMLIQEKQETMKNSGYFVAELKTKRSQDH